MIVLLLLLAGCVAPADDEPPPAPQAKVVTFNTGTTEGMGHNSGPDDGYTEAHAVISDTWYGDGLAWVPAVEAATDFFADVQPDVVGFQEVFFSDLCAKIPREAQDDFVCETWSAGDPTVAQTILGPGYQVACHPGKDDKCLAVRTGFGSFAGCDDDFCLEGLDGGTVDGCGSGSRVGRGTIELVDGGTLTVVNVHGSSGLSGDDADCRAAQVDQVFVDLGGGEPAANGQLNLVLGDLNTDPGRWTNIDVSAARWTDFVGGDHPFAWHTEVGEDALPTYSGLANIDHVASDFAAGDCWHAGTSPGKLPVSDARYFDHQPAVCTLTW